MTRSTALLVMVGLAACAPKARPPADTAASSGEPAAAAVPQGPAAATPAPTPTPRVPSRAESAVESTQPVVEPRVPSPRPSRDVPSISVAEVVDSAKWVGQVVRVSGSCSGYTGSVADGPPPLTRSDWLLRDAGRAVYVTGPLPAGCTAAGSTDEVRTVTAVVAEDTLRLPGTPGRPRRYLAVRPGT